MKKIFKLSKWLIISIYVVSGILLVVFLWPRSGWRVYRVVTGSMTPAIPQGSLVVDHTLSPRNYRIGQVVTYKDPYSPGQTITHRIVSKSTLGGSNIPTFVTKGDANRIADKPIVGGNIVGEVAWHVPYAGRVLGWLKIPAVFVILIIIPALIIIFDELRLLIRILDATKASKEDKHNHDDTPPSGGGHRAVPHPPTAPPRPRRRGVDTIARHAAVLLLVAGFSLGVTVTYAKLTARATLADNTITTATLPVNGVCPPGTTIASITNTGPGSHNQITVTNICTINVSNTTTVNINNSSSQTSSSGSTSSSGNTNGGTASSGSTSDSNSTDTSVTVTPPSGQ